MVGMLGVDWTDLCTKSISTNLDGHGLICVPSQISMDMFGHALQVPRCGGRSLLQPQSKEQPQHWPHPFISEGEMLPHEI